MRSRCARTYPEPVVSAGVSEVDDKFERFVEEGLEGEEDVIDQQVPIDIHHSDPDSTALALSELKLALNQK